MGKFGFVFVIIKAAFQLQMSFSFLFFAFFCKRRAKLNPRHGSNICFLFKESVTLYFIRGITRYLHYNQTDREIV